MTTGEIARTMDNISSSLQRIETKLDSKIDKHDQHRKDDEQDNAIKDVEIRLDKLVFGFVGVALTAIAGLLVALGKAGIG